MATESTPRSTRRTAPAVGRDWRGEDTALMRTLELVFFTHLQMADIADQVLAQHELGRPHHRVLYFAERRPGITVGELMTMLRVSNQALSRTTNQLVSLGLVEQRYSPEDRRVRQHFTTEKGSLLLETLTRRQLAFIRKAHMTLPLQDIEAMWRSLSEMTRKEDIPWVTPHPLQAETASPRKES